MPVDLLVVNYISGVLCAFVSTMPHGAMMLEICIFVCLTNSEYRARKKKKVKEGYKMICKESFSHQNFEPYQPVMIGCDVM